MTDWQTDLPRIKRLIDKDGVICYPTEAVWGLGCHPQSETAFEAILTLKQRPQHKGVIIIAGDYSQLAPYAKITPSLQRQLQNFWAGFVTCVLPKSDDCPDYLTGQFDGVAVRLTANPTVQVLCHGVGSALVSTSANLSGQVPVTNLAEARQTFGNNVGYYVDAPLGGEKNPSRIIQLIDNNVVVLRDG